MAGNIEQRPPHGIASAVRTSFERPDARVNLMTMKQRLLANRPRGEALCCCIPVDRDPSMSFGAHARLDGSVCMLRTKNDKIWIMLVDCCGTVTLSRCLHHPVERLGLQSPCIGNVVIKKTRCCDSLAMHVLRL